MANQDQLEIIAANGQIEFYNLDPAKGLTNIGRHPENDIVIDDPDIDLFHAMLDHRQKPYRFVLLSAAGQTRLRGEMLFPNGATPLQNLDTIELGSCTLILMESQGGQPSPAAAPAPQPTPIVTPPPTPPPASTLLPTSPTLPARPAAISPPPTRPEWIRDASATPPPTAPIQPQLALAPATSTTATSTQGIAGFFTSLPPNRADEMIVTELSVNEAIVDVDQTAVFELTLTNGGPLVAAFAVTVQGIDPNWLTISEPYVNLNEGERTTTAITITPPRLPSSRAGQHYFAIIVTSSDYPGHQSQHGATLVINPYYEFGVGELSPKQQTISWFRRSAQANLLVMNRGNGEAPLRLEGSDDERACSFEFQVPGEEVGLAMQAEMRLPPETSVPVPIRLTPHSRRLFSFRKRTYAYTITTTLLEGAQTPRSMLGQLGHKPLFGLWQILLLALLLVVLIVYIFRPTITFFSAEPRMVRAGEEVVLRWRASPFANLRLNGGVGAVEESIGEMVVTPEEDITYELRSENWVSWLTSGLLSYRREAKVQVEPVNPVIRVFHADKDSLFAGEETNLSWEVLSADEVTLTSNGVPETLLPAEHTSQRVVSPANDSTYSLTARNRFGEVIESVEIRVNAPPVPTPFVRRFTVNPQVIVSGESVVLDWEVEGADAVQVSPVGEVPPVQSLSQSPPQSIEYVLVASKGEARSQPIIRQVVVNTPTPGPTATPEPEAPVIEFFTASPDEIIKGEEESIDLAWSIVGETTNIEISGPDIGIISGLDPQGSIAVSADAATLFILTASNGSLKASQTVQVKDQEPTPTPEPPPPTATPLPVPNIVSFRAVAANEDAKIDLVTSSEKKNVYKVVAGSNIRLEWIVQNNPTNVTLTGPGGTFAGRAPEESNFSEDSSLNPVKNNGTFNLAAENKEEAKDTYTIEIQAVPQEPPPPPRNFQYDMGLSRFSWSYDPDFYDEIIGFRIYQSDQPNDPIVNELDLKVERDSNGEVTNIVLEWSDPGKTKIVCGQVYFIVAVYKDISDLQKKETDSAAESIGLPDPC